jgi:CBS domain-containing protein
MRLQGKALRLIIYIGESDQYQGKPLYMALLQLLKGEGAAGATVVRGLAGFGARSRIHTATILALSEDLPLRLEWVDQPELVERLLPQLRQMVDAGLITVETVDVVQYAAGRRPDPLNQLVRDLMRPEVISVPPSTPVAEIVTLLLQRGYRSLPVVDSQDHLLGLITDGDLLRQVGLIARLDLQADLPLAGWQQQLEALRRRPETAADIMTQPLITLSTDASLHRAATLMVQHDLKRLPVVDASQRLVGWISRVDVLRTLEYQRPQPAALPEPPTTGATIADLMIADAPTVLPEADLEAILQALEENRRRRVVVIDDQRRVVGIITDGDLLRRSQPQAHPGLLARLRGLASESPAAPVALPEASDTAASLMSTPVITVTLATPLVQALSLTLQHRIKRLPVVDEEGRLVGLLGRASLLRGLLAAA